MGHARVFVSIFYRQEYSNATTLLPFGAARHGHKGDNEQDPPVPKEKPARQLSRAQDSEVVTYFWKKVFSGTSSGFFPSGPTTIGLLS